MAGNSMHFYAWKSGLKTRMYYLRTKSAVDAIKFTLDNAKFKPKKKGVQLSKNNETLVTTSSKQAGGANTENNPAADVEPLTPAELKQMLEQSKKSEDDDCLMRLITHFNTLNAYLF